MMITHHQPIAKAILLHKAFQLLLLIETTSFFLTAGFCFPASALVGSSSLSLRNGDLFVDGIKQTKGLSSRLYQTKWDDLVVNTAPPDLVVMGDTGSTSETSSQPAKHVDICVIGGGVSGLTAALTAANSTTGKKILLLEATDTIGGRVQSDRTEDGYILDRGFAVFIEEYPVAKQLLDYDALKLGRFLPGALVKVDDSGKLARVDDPLRTKGSVKKLKVAKDAVVSPVGTMKDKIRLLPAIMNVRKKSIAELFEEPETNTFVALKERWKFSNNMMERFFQPFLEGIFLAKLHEQSSHLFGFIFKMFSEGYVSLPKNGMGAISDQLANKARSCGVDIRVKQPVCKLSKQQQQDEHGYSYLIETVGAGQASIQAKSVIVATDSKIADKLLSNVLSSEGSSSSPSLENKENIEHRSVGCIYYTFDTPVPMKDPILILNGVRGSGDATKEHPVNNLCFPSVINPSYSPAPGKHICSVTILQDMMEQYRGKEEELDKAVRKQLGSFFPNQKDDILKEWKLRKIYDIPNAQPSQDSQTSLYPANVMNGRDCSTFQNKQLPFGLYVCGDHMATSSLNGALQSGLNAGRKAADVAVEEHAMARVAEPVLL